jgi:energy-converting hydrogenase A subunit R
VETRIKVISDWEGPKVYADHAQEVTKAVVPNGGELFKKISNYDDYVYYIRKQPGYNPGDTLYLIAPFLYAYDINDRIMINVAQNNANFIKGAIEDIRIMQGADKKGFFVVSTSYQHYVDYTTGLAGIPIENTRSTRFPIEQLKQHIQEEDKEFVREMIPKILCLHDIDINASSTKKDIPPETLETIKELDRFFFEDLPKTSFKPVLDTVKPIGGKRKTEALYNILEVNGGELNYTFTIGDSITDVDMLGETKRGGGLAAAFNGNSYGLANAQVAIISTDCRATSVLAQIYERAGIGEVEEVTRDWNLKTLAKQVMKGSLDEALLKKMVELSNANEFPKAYWLTNENRDRVAKESSIMRKLVRGNAANLG